MDTDKQKEILQNFILEFLPKKGNNRKYSTNEIDYVTQAIEWVCMKYLGFRPTDKEVFEAFNMLGYSMLEKIYDCSYKGKCMNGEAYPSKYLYVDVNPVLVKNLRLTTKTLPQNTSPEKIEEIEKLKKRIEAFKNKYIDA